MKNSENAKSIWIRKTYKQKVTPRTEDVPKLDRLNETLVKLWNTAVNQVNTWLALPSSISYDEKWCKMLGLDIQIKNPDKPSITPITLNFWLTGVRDNSEFASVSVVLEREMCRRLAGGFSSYFSLLKKGDNKARPPAIKDPRKSFIALTWTEKSFCINGSTLTSSIGSKEKVEFNLGEYITQMINNLPEGSKIAHVTISKNDGEFWINIVCNIPTPKPVEPKGIIAIDLGAGNIALSYSDGREFLFSARRPDKKWRKEILQVEKRLEGCVKGSRAWKRRMGARRTMHNKSLHQHTDHQRKFANWIAKQGMTVVVGKMKTRLGLSKSEGTPDQHWGVQNTGYAFRLLIFLREKMVEYGLRVIEFPDPTRSGNLERPYSKFNASRELLQLGCEQLGIPYPNTFRHIDFSFKQ